MERPFRGFFLKLYVHIYSTLGIDATLCLTVPSYVHAPDGVDVAAPPPLVVVHHPEVVIRRRLEGSAATR